MMNSTVDQLEAYTAVEAPPRGAQRRWALILGIGGLVLAVAGAALFSGTGRDESPDAQGLPIAADPTGSGTSCEAPQPRPDHITAEQIAEAEANLRVADEEFRRTGRRRLQAQSLVDGSWACGWFVPIADFAGLEAAAAAGATAGIPGLPVQPVYAESSGSEIVGYGFGMGFVPAELVETGSFDIAGALAERYGCTGVADAELASCLGYDGLSDVTSDLPAG